jgi:hypothetical protein
MPSQRNDPSRQADQSFLREVFFSQLPIVAYEFLGQVFGLETMPKGIDPRPSQFLQLPTPLPKQLIQIFHGLSSLYPFFQSLQAGPL